MSVLAELKQIGLRKAVDKGLITEETLTGDDPIVEYNGKKGKWRTVMGKKIFLVIGGNMRDVMAEIVTDRLNEKRAKELEKRKGKKKKVRRKLGFNATWFRDYKDMWHDKLEGLPNRGNLGYSHPHEHFKEWKYTSEFNKESYENLWKKTSDYIDKYGKDVGYTPIQHFFSGLEDTIKERIKEERLKADLERIADKDIPFGIKLGKYDPKVVSAFKKKIKNELRDGRRKSDAIVNRDEYRNARDRLSQIFVDEDTTLRTKRDFEEHGMSSSEVVKTYMEQVNQAMSTFDKLPTSGFDRQNAFNDFKYFWKEYTDMWKEDADDSLIPESNKTWVGETSRKMRSKFKDMLSEREGEGNEWGDRTLNEKLNEVMSEIETKDHMESLIEHPYEFQDMTDKEAKKVMARLDDKIKSIYAKSPTNTRTTFTAESGKPIKVDVVGNEFEFDGFKGGKITIHPKLVKSMKDKKLKGEIVEQLGMIQKTWKDIPDKYKDKLMELELTSGGVNGRWGGQYIHGDDKIIISTGKGFGEYVNAITVHEVAHLRWDKFLSNDEKKKIADMALKQGIKGHTGYARTYRKKWFRDEQNKILWANEVHSEMFSYIQFPKATLRGKKKLTDQEQEDFDKYIKIIEKVKGKEYITKAFFFNGRRYKVHGEVVA